MHFDSIPLPVIDSLACLCSCSVLSSTMFSGWCWIVDNPSYCAPYFVCFGRDVVSIPLSKPKLALVVCNGFATQDFVLARSLFVFGINPSVYCWRGPQYPIFWSVVYLRSTKTCPDSCFDCWKACFSCVELTVG